MIVSCSFSYPLLWLENANRFSIQDEVLAFDGIENLCQVFNHREYSLFTVWDSFIARFLHAFMHKSTPLPFQLDPRVNSLLFLWVIFPWYWPPCACTALKQAEIFPSTHPIRIWLSNTWIIHLLHGLSRISALLAILKPVAVHLRCWQSLLLLNCIMNRVAIVKRKRHRTPPKMSNKEGKHVLEPFTWFPAIRFAVIRMDVCYSSRCRNVFRRRFRMFDGNLRDPIYSLPRTYPGEELIMLGVINCMEFPVCREWHVPRYYYHSMNFRPAYLHQKSRNNIEKFPVARFLFAYVRLDCLSPPPRMLSVAYCVGQQVNK